METVVVPASRLRSEEGPSSTQYYCTMPEYDRGSYPIKLLCWGRTEREREGESRPFVEVDYLMFYSREGKRITW
jgi:hypothetical protein